VALIFKLSWLAIVH